MPTKKRTQLAAVFALTIAVSVAASQTTPPPTARLVVEVGHGGRVSKVAISPRFQVHCLLRCYRFTAYSQLTMPALIVVGKYDGAIGSEQMQTLAAKLPNARFDEFDRSAHFVYAEQPAKFVRDVTAFVTSAK